MAVAFDAKSRNAANDTTLATTGMSWTHTPVGTPRGVVVCVIEDLNSDQVTGVTYGGVTMTRVRFTPRNVTETSSVYLYFLGTGIPTGAQTVVVSVTAGAAPKVAHCYTVTAASDTGVDASNGSDLGIIANPSLTVTHTGSLSSWFGVAAHYYGGAAPVATGLQTGETYGFGVDFGAAAGHTFYRTANAAASSSTYGYTTLVSDDQLIAALVLKETATIPAGTATGTWSWSGSATGKRTPKASATGTFTFTGTATGKRVPKATASGSWAWSGTAVGAAPSVAPSTGTASGTVAWTGTATGKRAPKASATGSFTFTGAAVGKRTPKATASGTVAYLGNATGKRTPKAAGTGNLAWSGQATGTAPLVDVNSGTATGTWTWAGSATGQRKPIATASGTLGWTGTAQAVTVHTGLATGTLAWTGAAEGARQSFGSANGLLTWTGEATGASFEGPSNFRLNASIGTPLMVASITAPTILGTITTPTLEVSIE